MHPTHQSADAVYVLLPRTSGAVNGHVPTASLQVSSYGFMKPASPRVLAVGLGEGLMKVQLVVAMAVPAVLAVASVAAVVQAVFLALAVVATLVVMALVKAIAVVAADLT